MPGAGFVLDHALESNIFCRRNWGGIADISGVAIALENPIDTDTADQELNRAESAR